MNIKTLPIIGRTQLKPSIIFHFLSIFCILLLLSSYFINIYLISNLFVLLLKLLTALMVIVHHIQLRTILVGTKLRVDIKIDFEQHCITILNFDAYSLILRIWNMMCSTFEKFTVEWVPTSTFKLLNTLLPWNLVTQTSLVSYFLRKHGSCREMSKARVVKICVTTNIPYRKYFPFMKGRMTRERNFKHKEDVI